MGDVCMWQGAGGIRAVSTPSAQFCCEYYSAIKKNEILSSAATWMDLEGIMLSEISQTEKDKYSVFSLIREI